MANFTYELSYAGIPFEIDNKARMAEQFMDDYVSMENGGENGDVYSPPAFIGKNLFGLARRQRYTMPVVKLGEYFYPNNASRWSMFRGQASTEIKNAMVAQAFASTQSLPQPFVMKCNSMGATALDSKSYSIETNLYMLPPRPLAVHSTQFTGQWIVTLVDERYYWQWKNGGVFHPTASTIWEDLIEALGTQLGVTITYDPIESAYLQPEPDSHLWTNYENAAVLLDAIAENLNRTFVRKLDGTYKLENNDDSVAIVLANRGNIAKIVRLAGGSIFGTSGNVANDELGAVAPESVTVTFPYYITSDVPHFKNTRQTGTYWIDDSYSSVYTKVITLADAGPPYASYNSFPGTMVLKDTCKALIDAEDETIPTNQTELDALALILAQNYYLMQTGVAIDEVYPGTLVWEPEGINDLTWTYKSGRDSLRVQCPEWNTMVQEFQHGDGTATRGGRVIPLTVRDDQTPQGDVANVRVITLTDGLRATQSATVPDEVIISLSLLFVLLGGLAGGHEVTIVEEIVNRNIYIDNQVNIYRQEFVEEVIEETNVYYPVISSSGVSCSTGNRFAGCCCPDRTMPSTLIITFGSGVLPCTCGAFSLALGWNGGTSSWVGFLTDASCAGGSIALRFFCIGEGPGPYRWFLNILCGDGFSRLYEPMNMGTVCDPFFTASSGGLAITITE